MNDICVLLATYNGEAFIKEQLESILAQEDVTIHLLIRDDGSTDRTLEIVEQYSTKLDIKLLQGKNLGAAMNFMELLQNADEYDYYAFCDQDDIWNRDKLAVAIKHLSDKQDIPCLYSCEYELVDEKGMHLGYSNVHASKITLGESIVGTTPNGCTMVFNAKLRQLVATSHPQYVRGHDYWMTMLVLALEEGVFIQDNTYVGMKYRLHGNNVSATKSPVIRLKRLLKSMTNRPNERQFQAKSLYDNHLSLLGRDEKELLQTIISYREGINRIIILFDKRFKTCSVYKNYLFKIACILGKF